MQPLVKTLQVKAHDAREYAKAHPYAPSKKPTEEVCLEYLLRVNDALTRSAVNGGYYVAYDCYLDLEDAKAVRKKLVDFLQKSGFKCFTVKLIPDPDGLSSEDDYCGEDLRRCPHLCVEVSWLPEGFCLHCGLEHKDD
jgi:hypothetical protein